MIYRIAEVFRSMQGEATHTGTPAAFIRLHGCSVGCPWCDTAYSWREPPSPVSFSALQTAQPGQPLLAEVTPEALFAWVQAQGVRHAVLTGGEPLEQDLTPLLTKLSWHYTQIETSGTVPLPGPLRRLIDWVTVSPKIGMPGGRPICPETIAQADEIKMPVGRERDLERLDDLLCDCPASVPVWLQPLSLSPTATALCLEAARQRGWRVSLQVHQLAALR